MHDPQERGVGYDPVGERDVGAGFELVVGFRGLVDPDREARDRARPLEDVDLGAEDGRDGHDVGVGAEGAEDGARAVDRRLGVHRQSALGCDAELEVLHEQESPERLAHAAPEHHHVE